MQQSAKDFFVKLEEQVLSAKNLRILKVTVVCICRGQLPQSLNDELWPGCAGSVGMLRFLHREFVKYPHQNAVPSVADRIQA